LKRKSASLLMITWKLNRLNLKVSSSNRKWESTRQLLTRRSSCPPWPTTSKLEQLPRNSPKAKLTQSLLAKVQSSSASATSRKTMTSNPAVKAVGVVAEEVVVEVTDLRLPPSVADAHKVVARAANLSSMTTTSQPYELAEVKSDTKKVTVKCLRHCMSYANDQSGFKSHCLSLGWSMSGAGLTENTNFRSSWYWRSSHRNRPWLQ